MEKRPSLSVAAVVRAKCLQHQCSSRWLCPRHLSWYHWLLQLHPESCTAARILSQAGHRSPAHCCVPSSLGMENGVLQTKLCLPLPNSIKTKQCNSTQPTLLQSIHPSPPHCHSFLPVLKLLEHYLFLHKSIESIL